MNKKYNVKKRNIINDLSKHWISKGVWFGDLIHKLKPATIDEWKQFLVRNKWFFIKGMNYQLYERRYWIWYLKNSFWKLYKSERAAIDYFKLFYKVDLIFADHVLDVKYGIDFYFKFNDKQWYLIVKHGVDQEFFNSTKTISNFNILIFDSEYYKLFDKYGVNITHLNSL